MYVLSKINNIHTYPKHKRVHNAICMKVSDSRVYMYVISFRQKLHIHEAKTCIKIGKTSVNEMIIKTRLYMYM